MTEHPHGTVNRYRRPYNCRCDECRAANRDYMREYSRRQREAGMPRSNGRGPTDYNQTESAPTVLSPWPTPRGRRVKGESEPCPVCKGSGFIVRPKVPE